MTVLTTGVLVNEKEDQSATDAAMYTLPFMSVVQSRLIIPSDPQSLVCQYCWDTGLFSADHFQEAWDGQDSYSGYTYTTSWSQIRASTESNCQWCRLLLSPRSEVSVQETVQVTVGFRSISSSHAITPKGVHILRLVVDDAPHFVYYVYAKQGEPPPQHSAQWIDNMY